MQRIALVTAAAARPLDDDLAPLAAALAERDIRVSIVDWDDPAVRWSQFDLALLRSTWDYADRLPEFLAWIERIEAQTCLENPPAIVRWNTDKHYLRELADHGVPIVPSVFCEPADEPASALDAFLADHATFTEFVVKPAIGAGSRDAQRHARARPEPAIAHLRQLLERGRSVLVQPYLDRVDQHGETALVHFKGEFSHAIRKGPLLHAGDAPSDALFAAEQIAARTPTAAERDIARRALDALPFAPPLYARVDLIRDADDAPCVLELELTEPSLFFATAPGSAARFADAILRRLAAPAAREVPSRLRL